MLTSTQLNSTREEKSRPAIISLSLSLSHHPIGEKRLLICLAYVTSTIEYLGRYLLHQSSRSPPHPLPSLPKTPNPDPHSTSAHPLDHQIHLHDPPSYVIQHRSDLCLTGGGSHPEHVAICKLGRKVGRYLLPQKGKDVIIESKERRLQYLFFFLFLKKTLNQPISQVTYVPQPTNFPHPTRGRGAVYKEFIISVSGE